LEFRLREKGETMGVGGISIADRVGQVERRGEGAGGHVPAERDPDVTASDNDRNEKRAGEIR